MERLVFLFIVALAPFIGTANAQDTLDTCEPFSFGMQGCNAPGDVNGLCLGTNCTTGATCVVGVPPVPSYCQRISKLPGDRCSGPTADCSGLMECLAPNKTMDGLEAEYRCHCKLTNGAVPLLLATKEDVPTCVTLDEYKNMFLTAENFTLETFCNAAFKTQAQRFITFLLGVTLVLLSILFW